MAGITVNEDGKFVLPSRLVRRISMPRDKAKAGRYHKRHGCPSRYWGDDTAGCRTNLQAAALRDMPADDVPVHASRKAKVMKTGKMTKAEAAAVRAYRAMKDAETIWTEFQRGVL